jgi:hypothetical protein
MGFDRPGISFEFAPAPAGFKWEKQEDGSYKLIYIKNQDGKQEKSSGT